MDGGSPIMDWGLPICMDIRSNHKVGAKLGVKTISLVGWARFLCPRGIKAIGSKWWAEKHCPPYIECRIWVVTRRSSLSLVKNYLKVEFQLLDRVDDKAYRLSF
jgi:hypothetical protein